MQSSKNVTLVPKSFSKTGAIGSSDKCLLTLPYGLPKWDIKVNDLHPYSKIFFIDGTAAFNLASSWIT